VWWEKDLARTRSQQNEDYQSYDSRLAGLVGLRSIIPLGAAPFFLVRLFKLEFNTLCTEVCVHSARGGGGTWGVCFRTNSLFDLRGKELVGDDDWKTMRNSPVPHKHPHRIASVGMHVPTDRGPSPVTRWIDRADSKEISPEDERQSEWCQPQGQRCQPHQGHQPRPQIGERERKNPIVPRFLSA